MNFEEESTLNPIHPPIYTSSFACASRQATTTTTTETILWLNDKNTIDDDQENENSNLDVSDCYLETSELSIPRCTAASTFQGAATSIGPFRRRDLPSYMSLRSSNRGNDNYGISCRFIDDSCILMASEIVDSQQQQSTQVDEDDDDDDDNQQTYVSELPTVLPDDFQPSTSSSLSSSSSISSTSNETIASAIGHSAEVQNNTSIKPPTCRSLYKYLIKRVSKRLGSIKKTTAITSEPVDFVMPEKESRPAVRVYAHNHKREVHAPSTSTANTSTATVAFLVQRRSNFYATNEHLRQIASPIGMKNFEWNRLNCGEFFSYNV